MRYLRDVNLSSMHRSWLFWCVSIALLTSFGIVQVHEAFPFLHHDAEFPGDYCPLCVIKYSLALALALVILLYTHPQMRTGLFRAPVFLRTRRIARRFAIRAPPVIVAA